MQTIQSKLLHGLGNTGGFTLTEIIAVVSLIGILGIWALRYDFQKNSETERLDRFAAKTASSFRHAKTAAVSGRTNVSGGCADYAIRIRESELIGNSVSFDGAGAVTLNCGSDPDSTIAAPMFGETDYKFMAITGYDKSGAVSYRIANSTDYTGTTGTTGNGVVVFIKGSTVKAYPITCITNFTSCVDYTNKNAVQLKVNVSYQQAYGQRSRTTSKDFWIDLRTGNIRVTDPTWP